MRSGFVVSPEGYILTNEHVVAKCREVRVAGTGNAGQMATDDKIDLELLKVSSGGRNAATFRGGRGVRTGAADRAAATERKLCHQRRHRSGVPRRARCGLQDSKVEQDDAHSGYRREGEGIHGPDRVLEVDRLQISPPERGADQMP